MLTRLRGRLGCMSPPPLSLSTCYIRTSPEPSMQTTGMLSEALGSPRRPESSFSTGKHWAFGKEVTKWCQSHPFRQHTEELFHASRSLLNSCVVLCLAL